MEQKSRIRVWARDRAARMEKAEIYRERAARCLRLAMRANTITTKLLWLDMSDQWLRLAAHAEGTRVSTLNPRPASAE
jgi:hypothetical protein